MILANFSLSFFTTVPGMLITGGVLLLLIALIIFIATENKKVKQVTSKKEDADEASTSTPSVNENIAVTPVVTNDVDASNVESNMMENDLSINSDVVTPPPINTALFSNDIKGANDLVNKDEPVKVSDNITPSVDSVNTSDMKDISSNIQADVTPSVVVPKEEKVEVKEDVVLPPTNMESDTNKVPSNNLPNEPVEVKDNKPIYGGASPVIPKINVSQSEHRPIYGGANPLDNTQNIPVNTKPLDPVNIPVVTDKITTKEEVKKEVEKPKEEIESLF